MNLREVELNLSLVWMLAFDVEERVDFGGEILPSVKEKLNLMVDIAHLALEPHPRVSFDWTMGVCRRILGEEWNGQVQHEPIIGNLTNFGRQAIIPRPTA